MTLIKDKSRKTCSVLFQKQYDLPVDAWEKKITYQELQRKEVPDVIVAKR